jgi:flagellar hook-length control protein FliK
MLQTSFLPSIFDLIPHADVVTSSQDKERPGSATFDGIFSKIAGEGDRAKQTVQGEEKAVPDEMQETRDPEQVSTEDNAGTAAKAGDVRENSEGDKGTSEADAEDTNDETDRGVSEKKTPTEEDAQGEGEDKGTTSGEEGPAKETETSESKNVPTENTEYVADNEITVMAMVEGPETPVSEGEERLVEGAEVPESKDVPSENTEYVGDNEITVMAMVRKPQAPAAVAGETPNIAEQAITDNDQEIPGERTGNQKAPMEQVAVEKDITSTGRELPSKVDVLPDTSSDDVARELPEAPVVKSQPAQAMEAKPVPEVHRQGTVNSRPAEVNVSQTVNDADGPTPNRPIYATGMNVEEMVTKETRANDAFPADAFTQTEQPREAALPLMKNVEVNLSLDADAQTPTDADTTKPPDLKETLEIMEGETPEKNAGRTGKTVQSETSQSGPSRFLEIERSVTSQIIRGTLTTFKSGRNELLLQLRPPDLGSVRIRLTLNDDTMAAKIIVSTEDVKEMVERQIDYLRNSLVDEGVRIERFEVSVGQQYERQATKNASAEDQQNPPGEARLTGDDRHRYDAGADAVRNIDKVRSENARIHVIA